MGAAFSDLMSLINAPVEARFLMVGLDAAGKTTILYKIRFGEVVQTTPTPGFNVETVDYKNLRMTVWDLGGQEKMRRNLWKQFYMGTQGVIFVIDSSDVDRLEDACEELQQMLRAEELRQAVVLVYANKQDLPHAVPASELTERLRRQYAETFSRRQWLVQPTCAISGQGVLEGLDWLAGAMQADQDWFTATLQQWRTQLGV
eukprot:TRINITY_DN32971_c0_g1_i1.p1 TRINITY_DN32971_c0_g1~~TRINITY_DN32971_c0_g1_i1.p1  ORF type:complete len:202 (-),score=56.29 TRINITY_DN32971_c0_g1_i1:406-1011(-)